MMIAQYLMFFYTLGIVWALAGCVPLQSEKARCKKNNLEQKAVQKTPQGVHPVHLPQPQLCLAPKQKLPAPFFKKVSLSLTGQIPLREAFCQLAQQACINIAVSGESKGTYALFYQANNQPLIEVVENLCHLHHLRYSFKNNTLHIAPDTPYLKTHNIQFLLGSRKTQTETSIKTDIFSEGLNKESKHISDNGASILLNTAHTVDFWDELEKTIKMILKFNASGSKNQASSYAMNKYAGILSLCATEKQHAIIAKYLNQLQKTVTAQILIEAKIIEIDLSDEYKGGVNWSAFIKKVKSLTGDVMDGASTAGWDSANFDSQDGQYSFNLQTSHLNALASFMEQFGQVRTLANPRQIVINNQAAILKVAHNEVFFELQVQDYAWNGHGSRYGPTQKAQSTIRCIPIGVILYVHPSLNPETGDIIVSLHPTLSRIIGRKSDPAVSMYNRKSNPIESQVPIVQVREMDSVIVAREGQVIVTGGLMEERCEKSRSGVPILSKAPLIGNFFSQKKEGRKVTELVIFLRLSVVKNQAIPGSSMEQSSSISPADVSLYEKFEQDPRPFPME